MLEDRKATDLDCGTCPSNTLQTCKTFCSWWFARELKFWNVLTQGFAQNYCKSTAGQEVQNPGWLVLLPKALPLEKLREAISVKWKRTVGMCKMWLNSKEECISERITCLMFSTRNGKRACHLLSEEQLDGWSLSGWMTSFSPPLLLSRLKQKREDVLPEPKADMRSTSSPVFPFSNLSTCHWVALNLCCIFLCEMCTDSLDDAWLLTLI